MEAIGPAVQERKVDISKSWLWEEYPDAFAMLLCDRSTGGNIIWATDSYADRGDGYGFYDRISPELITGANGMVIRPRALKNRDEQIRRVKDKAEVFTPSWVCNAQNNLIDEVWFGRPDAFNREVAGPDGCHSWIPTQGKIVFPEGKKWQDYVRDTRLEITCGEAPYLVSRYDAVSGDMISDLNMRIGLLDRKLRVVSENTDTSRQWLFWARKALENTYGYEWQGDNLLLAREAVLFTFIEYYSAKFGRRPAPKTLKTMAFIISWNLWQMDGLKCVVPGSCDNKYDDDGTVTPSFAEWAPPERRKRVCPACRKGKGLHIGTEAVICDWAVFHKLSKEQRQAESAPYRVPFRSLINN